MDQPQEFLAPNGPPCVPDSLFEESFNVDLFSSGVEADGFEMNYKKRPGFTTGPKSSDMEYWAGMRRTSPDTVCCAHCKSQIAFVTQILTKDFYYLIAPPALHADHLYCPSFGKMVDAEKLTFCLEEEEDGNENDEDEDDENEDDEDDENEDDENDENEDDDNEDEEDEEDEDKENEDEDEASKPYVLSHPHFARKDLAKRWRSNNLPNVVLSKLLFQKTGDNSENITTISDVYCATCDRQLGYKTIDETNAEYEYTIGRFMIRTDLVIIRKHYDLIRDVDIENMEAGLEMALPDPKPDSDAQYFAKRSQNAVALAESNPIAAAMAHNNLRLRRAHALQRPDDPTLLDLDARGPRDHLQDQYETSMLCCVADFEQTAGGFFTPEADAVMHRRCQLAVDTYRLVRDGSKDQPVIPIEESKNGFSSRERRNLVVAPHLDLNDDDRHELDMLFGGEWDPVEVARMREIKRTALAYKNQMSERATKWLYEKRLVGVIEFVEHAGSLALVAGTLVHVYLMYFDFLPWFMLYPWVVCVVCAQIFLMSRHLDQVIIDMAAKGHIGLDYSAPGMVLKLAMWEHQRRMDVIIEYRIMRRWIKSKVRAHQEALLWLCVLVFGGIWLYSLTSLEFNEDKMLLLTWQNSLIM